MGSDGFIKPSYIQKQKDMYENVEVPAHWDWSVFINFFLMPFRKLCCKNCETKFHREYMHSTRGVKETLDQNLDLVNFIKRMRRTVSYTHLTLPTIYSV